MADVPNRLTPHEGCVIGWLCGKIDAALGRNRTESMDELAHFPLLALGRITGGARFDGIWTDELDALVNTALDGLRIPENVIGRAGDDTAGRWMCGYLRGREGLPAPAGHDIRALRRERNLSAERMARTLRTTPAMLRALELDPESVTDAVWTWALQAADRAAEMPDHTWTD